MVNLQIYKTYGKPVIANGLAAASSAITLLALLSRACCCSQPLLNAMAMAICSPKNIGRTRVFIKDFRLAESLIVS